MGVGLNQSMNLPIFHSIYQLVSLWKDFESLYVRKVQRGGKLIRKPSPANSTDWELSVLDSSKEISIHIYININPIAQHASNPNLP